MNLMPELGKHLGTFQMVGIRSRLALLLGVPIGLLLFIMIRAFLGKQNI